MFREIKYFINGAFDGKGCSIRTGCWRRPDLRRGRNKSSYIMISLASSHQSPHKGSTITKSAEGRGGSHNSSNYPRLPNNEAKTCAYILARKNTCFEST